MSVPLCIVFFFSSRRRHTRCSRDWSSDVCSSDLYQALVEDAVRLQLRSDVPVGLFFSSGVDSGRLVAIASKYVNQPIQTFTIGFEEGERSSETADARAIAEQLGAGHSDMNIRPKG